MPQCTAVTSKGSRCKHNTLSDTGMCKTHEKKRGSRNFIGRFSTLIHDAAVDIVNRLPRNWDNEAEYQNTCQYCKQTLTKDSRSKDHVMRLVTNSRISPLTNLSHVTVPCCNTCNSSQIGQKNPVFTDSDVKIMYKIEREDELNEEFENLRVIMEKIQNIINTSNILVVQM